MTDTDSCTHGEESLYCVICHDDYVRSLVEHRQKTACASTINHELRIAELEKENASLREELNLVRNDLSLVSEMANMKHATVLRYRDDLAAEATQKYELLSEITRLQVRLASIPDHQGGD